jgi:uncharacterized iron-regulated membrane protein
MPKPPKKSGFSWKSALFTLHLWLGLASGLLFSLVCTTGFLIALHPVLEARLNPQRVQHQGEPLLAEQTVAQGIAALNSTPRWLRIPAHPEEAWVVRGKDGNLALDPWNGQLLEPNAPFWQESYQTLMRLHRWLLLDSKVGRRITGVAAIIYLFVLSSGAALWLTRCYRNLARGLTFRRKVGWKRWAYDAHLVLGIYATLPLMLMAGTGLYWSYREPYRTVVYRVLDGTPAPAAKKKEPARGEERPKLTALPYQAILQRVHRELPYPGEVRIHFPQQGDDIVEVDKIRLAGPLQMPTRDILKLDVETAEVRGTKLFSELTRAEKFTSQILNLHTGALLGDLTLVLYLLATAVGASLPITGTVMWWNRQQGQRKSREILARRAREKAAAPPPVEPAYLAGDGPAPAGEAVVTVETRG